MLEQGDGVGKATLSDLRVWVILSSLLLIPALQLPVQTWCGRVGAPPGAAPQQVCEGMADGLPGSSRELLLAASRSVPLMWGLPASC